MRTGRKGKRYVLCAAFAAAAVAGSSCAAYGAGDVQTQSMELTVRKDASYILTIPESQEIAFGAVDTKIGELSVTGAIGTKQEVQVSVETTEFVDTADAGNHFAFTLYQGDAEFDGKAWSSQELKEPENGVELSVRIPTATWENTAPGTYQATVTFRAELRESE